MDEALVDRVVAQVLLTLRGEVIDTRLRKVAMIFSGTPKGFSVGQEAFRRISGKGHQARLLFTPAAKRIFSGEGLLQSKAAECLGEDHHLGLAELIHEIDLVLVPTLTMRLAHRVAWASMEDPAAAVIIAALLAGKPVIGVRGGSSLQDDYGTRLGARRANAPQLWDRVEEALNVLITYGLELVPEAAFLIAVEQAILRRDQLAIRKSHIPPPAMGRKIGGNIVTEAEILGLEEGSSLQLSNGAKLTPQAQDRARRLKLSLFHEPA